MKLRIYSQISAVASLKFGKQYVISSHTGCSYLFMLELCLIWVSKRGSRLYQIFLVMFVPDFLVTWIYQCRFVFGGVSSCLFRLFEVLHLTVTLMQMHYETHLRCDFVVWLATALMHINCDTCHVVGRISQRVCELIIQILLKKMSCS